VLGASGGVDAVFDHLGGDSIPVSYGLLNRTGTLVSYSIAGKIGEAGPVLPGFLMPAGKLAIWNYLPTGRRASFYNVWAGPGKPGSAKRAAFQDRTRTDLTYLFGLLLPAGGGRRGAGTQRIVRPDRGWQDHPRALNSSVHNPSNRCSPPCWHSPACRPTGPRRPPDPGDGPYLTTQAVALAGQGSWRGRRRGAEKPCRGADRARVSQRAPVT
jgi:hypothetical protein